MADLPDSSSEAKNEMLRRFGCYLEPLSGVGVSEEIGHFVSFNTDPEFILTLKKGQIKAGWMELTIQLDLPERHSDAAFYFDTGQGFQESVKATIPLVSGEITETQVEIPTGTKRIRFDPCDCAGKFEIRKFDLKPLSRLLLLGNAVQRSSKNITGIRSLITQAKKGFSVLRTGGFSALGYKVYGQSQGNYAAWVERYDTLDEADRAAIRKTISEFTYTPLVSVVMPTYNTNEKWLRSAIESVQAQLYKHWELCIADDCSSDETVRRVIKEYAARDRRIKYVFRKENGHISASSNSALTIATGEFVALLDHDDELPENALFRVVQLLNQNPNSDVIYSDEDKIDEEGQRYDPYFKPDWMPDLYNCQNFTSHLSVYRKSFIDQVGGFRVGYEGAQDWDLMMRITEIVPHQNIKHLPYILYHWRAIQGSTARSKNEKSYAEVAQERTITDHFNRTHIPMELSCQSHGYWRIKYRLVDKFPSVCLIIPTRDRIELLKRCVTSIIEKTSYPNYKILIVDNGSSEVNALEYFNYLTSSNTAQVLEFPHPFNYSAINNFAVEQAESEVVVLLNNDTEVISSNWLEEMVSLAIRPQTGAVGAKLYYPDGTIQHAGVILGIMGVANHAYIHQPHMTTGQFGRAMLTQNYSAVTGACLAIEKRKYLEVGGLNEKELKVAFNDIDFCLKLLRAGYRNAWTPYAELYHHESASRGLDTTDAAKARFSHEIAYMLENWGDILKLDPAYNPNLTLEKMDFSLAFPHRVSKV